MIKKWNKKLSALLVLTAILAAFGSTWAYYGEEVSLTNPLRTSHSGAAIVEDFDPDSSFLPGETVVKKAAFKNTGDADLYLRVEIPADEGWYRKGSLGKLERVNEYSTEFVIKNWTKAWKAEETDSSDENAETGQWSAAITDPQSQKTYRYYKRILPAGDTTDAILESITLSPEVSNDRHAADYSDKIYKLTFNAEAVPVEMAGDQADVTAQWNVTVTAEEADGTLIWRPADASGKDSESGEAKE